MRMNEDPTQNYHYNDCVEYVINTEPQQFLAWLRVLAADQDYNRRNLAWRIKMGFEGDESPSISRDIATAETETGALIACIQAFYPSQTQFDVLAIKLVSPAPGRTQIKACWNPYWRDYSNYFFDRLRAAYPEVANAERIEYANEMYALWIITLEFLARERDQKELTIWPTLPWSTVVPLPFINVESACDEHLYWLSGKRYPEDWDLQVIRYVEQQDIALRYDIHSGGRVVGHLGIRRIDAQQTRLNLSVNLYGDESDEARLREIVKIFARRWMGDLAIYQPVPSPSLPVVNVQLPKTVVNLQRRPSGRPSDKSYDRAFQVILEGSGSDEAWQTAYNLYCDEQGIRNPDKGTQDAFRRAIKRRMDKLGGLTKSDQNSA